MNNISKNLKRIIKHAGEQEENFVGLSETEEKEYQAAEEDEAGWCAGCSRPAEFCKCNE